MQVKEVKEKVVLNFQYLGRDSALKMIIFSDALFWNLSDGGTKEDTNCSHRSKASAV